MFGVGGVYVVYWCIWLFIVGVDGYWVKVWIIVGGVCVVRVL